MNKDAISVIDTLLLQTQGKSPMRAVIREAECIGCVKCVQACPVDAIVGAAKVMHTVLTDSCIGCELCVAPCPVDCIDMIALPQKSDTQKKLSADQARSRYAAHLIRLHKEKTTDIAPFTPKTMDERKAAIQAILKRART